MSLLSSSRAVGWLKPKSWSVQYASYTIHSFVGLKLSLLFTVVVLSGALAVIAEEIDWLFYSEVRAAPTQERLDAGVLFDKLQAAYPEHGLSFFQTMEQQPYFASFAMFNDEQGGFRYAWINPYSGEVQGDTPVLTVGRFIGFLHATLYLPVIGRSLVNTFGILPLISLIAGLYAYPKFWQQFLRKPRTQNRRVFWADLHKLIGLWSLWFVLIIGVTGSWWFYKNPLVQHFGATSLVEPTLQIPLLSDQDMQHKQLSVLGAEGITARVKEAYPQAKILMISPPEHNAEPYEVTFEDSAWLVPAGRQNKLYISPLNGEIVGQRLVTDHTAMQRLDSAMTPLHYGNWALGNRGDLLVKGVWFIFGLLLTALCISGLIIHLKRTVRAGRISYRRGWRRQLIQLWRIVRPWGRPFGLFKYINVLLILGIAVGCSIAFTLSSQGTKGAGEIYPEITVGPWLVSANAVAGLLEKDISPIKSGGSATFYVELPLAALDQIKFAYLNVGKPRTMRAPGYLIHGPHGAKHVDFALPRQLVGNEELWISIETWEGRWYQASWPLKGEDDSQ